MVHPTQSSVVYVATDTGVHRGRPGLATTLGGTPSYTWDRLLAGRATDLVVKHDNPLVMLAGIHDDGIYKTVDGAARGAG